MTAETSVFDTSAVSAVSDSIRAAIAGKLKSGNYIPCPANCGGVCTRKASLCERCRGEMQADLIRSISAATGKEMLTLRQLALRTGILEKTANYRLSMLKEHGTEPVRRTSTHPTTGTTCTVVLYPADSLLPWDTYTAGVAKRIRAENEQTRAAQLRDERASKEREREERARASARLPFSGSPLVDLINRTKPDYAFTGFRIARRPTTGEYRAVPPGEGPQVGERLLLEYRRIVVPSTSRANGAICQVPVWGVFPAPLTDESVHRAADRLQEAEYIAAGVSHARRWKTLIGECR